MSSARAVPQHGVEQGAGPAKPRYTCFLSYPHESSSATVPPASNRPSSAAITDALYTGLRRFGRRWNAWADITIFRDKRSLPAGSPLWDVIEQSIGDSAVFLLLAVSRTAASPGVAREIGYWKQHGHHPEHFLILWLEGDIQWLERDLDFDWSHTTVLPECLKGYFKHEPTIVDLRWLRDAADLRLGSKPFREALAAILSPVRGVPPGELIDEANTATRQVLALARWVVTVFAIFSVLLAGIAWYANRKRSEAQTNLAEAKRQRAEAERQTGIATVSLAEANCQRKQAVDARAAAEELRLEAERQRNLAVA
jgi:hypothetical protein